ncbi:hypothetical protein [Mucilaginibacter celer]|uniref:Uncharacterized protein n=1 Tax=Mucilaginibacter celer TaxID=2305508 RepID=A0A494VNT5_9SPHI|nr:hypothetical protein [Mucilaginibacter celer]AYL97096.1 hypothetical protein HYN43_018065 [Mucilaginibacter celer]
MISLIKLFKYLAETDDAEVLKAYYEKCNDNLKELNKRSNWLSQFILLLSVLCLFPRNFTTIKFLDIDFDFNLIHLITPTLLSYLIFEWLMVARRRRDLIVTIQQLTYKIFKINPEEDEAIFPAFNPNTLNIMPFSIMNEASNIERKNKFNLYIIRAAILCMPMFLITIIIISIISSIKSYHLEARFIWPTTIEDFIDTISLYFSITTCLLFIIWIVYYYITECKHLSEIKRLANQQNAQID